MKTIQLVVLFFMISFNLNAQEIEKMIEVKEIGKHFNNSLLNSRSSKKLYEFHSNGMISRILKYGRYHYAYLHVIGRIISYKYQNDTVIEIDSSYCCEDDENIRVSIDTNNISYVSLQYIDLSCIFDSTRRLIQSSNNYQLKKYEYNEKGLISRITFYYKWSNDKASQLRFIWKNEKRLSKETINSINNFIVWHLECFI